MRIFLDANVLFSAAKSDGAVRELVTLLAKAGHEPWVDDYVLEEARRNLAAKAPDAVTVLERLAGRLKRMEAIRLDRELEASLPVHEKGRPVLAAAIHGRCQALVTGDTTHFGALFGKQVHGVAIHSPRSAAIALL